MIKKVSKWILVIIAVLVAVFFAIDSVLNGISYKETLKTQYHKAGENQIVETPQFKIETPKMWIHISHGTGIEGGIHGCFLTGKGIVDYEYTFFANSFKVDSINVFKSDSLQLGRFEVFLGTNEINETGIHIPVQHEMELPFSLFMSHGCTENITDLKNGIKTMTFKEYYKPKWEENMRKVRNKTKSIK